LVRQKNPPKPSKELATLRAEGEIKEKALEQMGKALESKSKELETTRNQALLLQADFENAKKRWLKSQSEIQEQAQGNLLRQFLEIFDDFERALGSQATAAESQLFRTGVEMIHKRIDAFLKSYGVLPLEATGKPFDPTQHEAVAHEPTDSVPESTVVAELKKGYLMNGRVLRPSVVKVAVKLGERFNGKIIRYDSKNSGGPQKNKEWLDDLEKKLSDSGFSGAFKCVRVDYDDDAEKIKFELELLTGTTEEIFYQQSSLPDTDVVIENFRNLLKK